MALALYRRHRRDCKAGHPEESRTSEYDERKKGWKRCECPIFLSGTLQGCFKRHNSGRWEWESAKALAGQFEVAGSWNGSNQSAAPAAQLAGPSNDSQPARIAIADAVQVFLTNRQGAKIAAATLRKYRTFTKQLADFAEARGYVMLDQFTSADIDVFYGSWKLGARAKGKALGTLLAFFASVQNANGYLWTPQTPNRLVRFRVISSLQSGRIA